MTEVQELEAIYRRIRHRHDWCQGVMVQENRVCLVGAAQREIPDARDRYAIRVLMDVRAADRGFASATNLNDSSSHRYVLRFVRQLIREAKQRERKRIARARREEEVRNMNIGKEERTIIVEPLQDPVPRREPAPTPERREPAPRRQPVKVPEREKVGA